MGLFDFIWDLIYGPDYGGYDSVVAWIKENHGDRFRDDMTKAEIRSALIGVRPRDAPDSFVKALETYITAEKYGNLVRVRQEG